MTNSDIMTPLAELKTQARRLREQLRETGVEITHSRSLELLARQLGARDWNTLRAGIGNEVRLQVGDRVEGRYLGQRFTGVVKSLTAMDDGKHRRVVLHFDDPVDVVAFDSFSSFRQRVRGTIGPDGCSPQRTSDGQPQLIVHRT